MRLCCPLNDTQGCGPAAEEAVVALAALAAAAAAAEPARAVAELVSGWRGGGEKGKDAGGHSCVLRVGARARSPASVLLADIHGSCSGSGGERVCVRVY